MSVLDVSDWWDQRLQQWSDALKAKGHMPAMYANGELNTFFFDSDKHNGPGCKACGWSCCWHCTDIGEIPQCTVLELQATRMIGTAT